MGVHSWQKKFAYMHNLLHAVYMVVMAVWLRKKNILVKGAKF